MTEVQRVDLTTIDTAGDGVHWTLAMPSDLNVNLVALEPGHVIGTHRNDEVDVLIVVLAGDGLAIVDDVQRTVGRDVLLHIPRGASRSVVAGESGIRYLTVHRSRGPVRIGSARP